LRITTFSGWEAKVLTLQKEQHDPAAGLVGRYLAFSEKKSTV